MNPKKHTYGFASTLLQARVHMTNPYTTFSDPKFMCFYFYQLANMALNENHSRDLFERGLVVDNKSASGLSVRDKAISSLSGSVDSRRMVCNLSVSQKYIKYTWFLTFSANHSEHPGLHFLHKWKQSKEWTSKIPKYNDLADNEKREIDKAMEEAYGINIYNNWRNAKHLLLLHIKHHMTIIGTTTSIFARNEYQTLEGNLSHNHLILAIDKSTMNKNSVQYIQDLIRTSVLEIIKTDSDLPRLINDGMLRNIDNVTDVVELADNILVHKCNERCKIKAKDGDSEDTLKCRKIHPVKVVAILQNILIIQ